MSRIFKTLLFISLFGSLNAQSLFKSKVFTQDSFSLPYRILYPENFNPNKIYPLVLFLHGAGERGDDNKKQLVHGSTLFEKSRKGFPAIVIFPQCPRDSYWTSLLNRNNIDTNKVVQYDQSPSVALSTVNALLDSFLNTNYIDKSRIYAAGLSMGGMGTLELTWRRPEVFAAAVVICGDGCLNCVKDYNPDLSIWFFHGAKDDIVLPKGSINIADSLKNVITEVKYTLYPEANHNSWDPAFAEPDLLPWLFSKSLN